MAIKILMSNQQVKIHERQKKNNPNEQEEEKRVLLSLEDTGLNFSDYVRKAISDHPIIVVSGIQDLHLQVARVGNNLNQLVMLAHEGRITSVDLTECFEMLQMTYSKLSEISEVINHDDCDSGPG